MTRTLRTLPLLAMVLALVLPGAPAAAQEGGSAACMVPVQVTQSQALGGMALEPGPYKLTILDTSDVSCDEAREAFRTALREPGDGLPDGWKFDTATRTLSQD